MANAEANLSEGLSSIANQTALNRVHNQISAIVQNVLKSANGSSGSSTTSSSATTSSTATGSSSTAATKNPATLTGKTVLNPGTSLSSLGILAGGTITVSAGTNATTYTSTGTDTIGDLVNAINVDLPTNAQVTASVSASGHLVITSRNNKDSIAVVGSGTDASAIGYGTKNSSAEPTAPSSTTASGTGSSTSSSSTSSSSSASSSSSGNFSSALSKQLAQQGMVNAQGILSANGVNGTLLNMLT